MISGPVRRSHLGLQPCTATLAPLQTQRTFHRGRPSGGVYSPPSFGKRIGIIDLRNSFLLRNNRRLKKPILLFIESTSPHFYRMIPIPQQRGLVCVTVYKVSPFFLYGVTDDIPTSLWKRDHWFGIAPSVWIRGTWFNYYRTQHYPAIGFPRLLIPNISPAIDDQLPEINLTWFPVGMNF